jgi:uncharacterized protein
MTALLRLPVVSIGALAVALAAGTLCTLLRVPLPWMIGPMLAVAAVRIGGWHIVGPPGGRQAGQWIIGTALGLYFTPSVVAGLGGIAGLLLVGALFAIALGYASGFLLARLAGTDRTTAIFASVPGGAAEMAVLGERFGARVDQVAAAQSVRILMVVVIVPSLFAVFRLHGADPFITGATDVRWPVLLALLSGTALAGLSLQRIQVPNAFVLGALAVVIPLTASGVDSSAMPRWMLNGAQLLLGCALGSRFNRGFVARAPRFVGAVVLTVTLAMLLSALFAAALAWGTGIHPATMVLATAPGGVAEMAITAKVLELGVPIVTAFHVTRVILLLTCTGPLFAWLRRRRRRPARPGGPVA